MLLRLLLQAEYFVLLRMRHVALTPRTLVAVDMVVDVVEETKKNLGFLKNSFVRLYKLFYIRLYVKKSLGFTI